MYPEIDISILSTSTAEDPTTPETPCKGSYSFRFNAEAEDQSPVTIFYSISKNDSNPSDPDYKMYVTDSELTIEEDEASVYYILVEAFAANGQRGVSVIPIYFEADVEEESSEEPEPEEDQNSTFVVNITVENYDENPATLVENVPYRINVDVVSGSGTVSLLPDTLPAYASLNEYDILNLKMGGDNIKHYSFYVMIGACHNGQGFSPVFNIEDDNGEPYIIKFDDFITRAASGKYPYNGNRIMWKKVSDAVNYNIYRSSNPVSEMRLLISVPADTYGSSKYQWYIDRKGRDGDFYSVSPVDASGREGDLSTPRTSPDYMSSVCLLQGSVVDLGLKGVEEVHVAYRIKEMPASFKSSLLIKGTNIVYTDERGFFEILLPQNSVVTIAIDDAGFKKSLVIPPLKAASLEDVMNMPQNIGDRNGHYRVI